MSFKKTFKNGLIHGLGFITVLSITGLAYASYTWVSQSTVTTGDTLTASAWNDMLNNQNYLKQEVEARLQNSGGSMSGNLDMSTNKVTNLGTPTASSDAATKAYADSVGASGLAAPRLCTTKISYTGNLGGFSGADAKCVADCGAGFTFARIGDLASFSTVISTTGRIDNDNSDCNSWTSGSSGHSGKYLSSSSSSWSMSSYNCSLNTKLICVRF